MAFVRRTNTAITCTPKELAFVAEYIANRYNLTQAYMMYKNTNVTSAGALSYRLLCKGSVVKEIERQVLSTYFRQSVSKRLDTMAYRRYAKRLS